jgi:(p)ppGpp synthase/HD superfamily hydrolase
MASLETTVEPVQAWDEASFSDDRHYRAIADLYGERTARRSGVPLIDHIREGLYILEEIGANTATKQAYCLHPLFQGDTELQTMTPEAVTSFDRWVIVLALEYRNIANAYLSSRHIGSIVEIVLSPLREVQQMLIADKVQNRKDFDAYHRGGHPRSDELDRYFRNWFERLGITQELYERLVSDLNAGKHIGKRP